MKSRSIHEFCNVETTSACIIMIRNRTALCEKKRSVSWA